MDVIGVIPARYGSTRFEGKVLADILGKPMIQWVWEQVKKARVLDEVIIACDDQRILEASRKFGAKAVLTSRDHSSGTDRIIEAVDQIEAKVVINIQADEPLLHPLMVDSLAQALLDDRSLYMATLVKKIENPHEISDSNVVKVTSSKDGFALYFSRAAIPYHAQNSEIKTPAYFKHIGLYGYTKDFLFTYKNLPQSDLEKTEKLEQLRVLEKGLRIKVIETKYETTGVDVPEDLEKVKRIIASQK